MSILILLFSLSLITLQGISQNAPAGAEVPVVSKAIQPKYPSDAEDLEIAGPITIKVAVDVAGNVTSSIFVSGPGWTCPSVANRTINLAREAAKAAALQTKFQPLSGPATTQLVFKFGSSPSHKNIDHMEQYMIDPPLKHLDSPPNSAKKAAPVGLVHVQLLIDVDGSIISAEPLDGTFVLQHSARDAACSAHFAPTLRDGHPIRVSGTIKYNFVP